MSLDGHADPEHSPATLVVADWVVDPGTVAATCAARDRSPALHLVVPAWLHGLDWAGDPLASVAQRAERLSGLQVTPVAVRTAPRHPRRRFLAGSHCAPATHALG